MNTVTPRAGRDHTGGHRPQHALPAWSSVLAVVAHPDDETFGLGAIVDSFTSTGAAVHVVCFSRGEASTLNAPGADLQVAREAELREASAELGVAGVTVLDYPDGGLSAQPQDELAGHVFVAAARHHADGILVFDETGVTGHPDHQAATAAAVRAATAGRLPVLAWTLPATTAAQLRTETGMAFAGLSPDRIALCVRVRRARQRRAAFLHASQISPTAVLWRRLQLQGDCEHLRWLIPPRSDPGHG